jgi:hypothetical protein
MEELDLLYARLLRAVSAGMDTQDALTKLSGLCGSAFGVFVCHTRGGLRGIGFVSFSCGCADRVPDVVRASDSFLVFQSTLKSFNKAEIRSNLIPFMQEQLSTLWPQVRAFIFRTL